MSKKLLEESTIRQFMKLAQLEPLSENFIDEGKHKKDDEIEEAYGADLEEAALEEAGHEGPTMEEMEAPVEEEMATPEMEEGMYPDMEEAMVYEDEDIEMDEGDAEINITPDQARAIIAVADMLKDIMPDLEAPEMDAEEEEEVEMPEPEMEPEAEEEEEVETPEGEEKEEEEVELQEEVVEESLEEQIMNRVKARLKELSNK